MSADPRPLFAAFNRGVQRARRAYQAEEKGASHDPTCRAVGCHRARDGHHARCGTCRRFVKKPLDASDLRLRPQKAGLSTGTVDNRGTRSARIPHASHMNQEKA